MVKSWRDDMAERTIQSVLCRARMLVGLRLTQELGLSRFGQIGFELGEFFGVFSLQLVQVELHRFLSLHKDLFAHLGRLFQCE